MLKKFLKWLFYLTLTLVLGITASLYLFKDRIIQQVLTEVNKYLVVPVNVSKVDIDFFHGFPNVSIAFYDIELPADADPVIEAKKFYTIINPIELVRGDLNVKRLEIVDADLHLYVDRSNQVNISKIFKMAGEENLEASDSAASGFNLNSIFMRDVRISYENDFTRVASKVTINELIGDFKLNQGVYETTVEADMIFQEHVSPSWSVKDIGEFTYDFDIKYEVASKTLTLDKSRFTFRGALADISGQVIFSENPKVDLNISAEDVSLRLLSELLPEKAAKFIRQYQSSGSISLTAGLAGFYTPTSMPGLIARLKFEDVDLRQKEFNANIQDLDILCDFRMRDVSKLSTGEFSISKASGLLQDKPFSLSFDLKNLKKPEYIGHVKAGFTSEWLLAALQYKNYETATGEVDLSLNINNKNVVKGALIESLNLSGAMEFDNVAFSLNDTVRVKTISGHARFSPAQIQLANLQLNWLSSDLTINGDIIGRSPDISNETYTLRSDIKSGKLAIEDIVTLVRASSAIFAADPASENNLQLDLDLVASLDSLTFRRFKGAKVTGEVLYQDKVIEVVDLGGRAMGGALRLNGKLKQMPNKDIVIQANARTKGVYIDSLFYVFNNFTQDFIRDEHLRGRVYADVEASMYFDKDWRFRRQLLTSYAKIGIVDGELNNFAPLMALSTYLDDKNDNLAHLKFSDLVNNVRIKEDTVFIPEMSIRTNVRNIALGGYHTLGQYINYQLAVPIINERVDKDEAFGAVRKSSKGSPNLLFTIKGTSTDYRVNYDLLRATGNVLKLLDITKIFKKNEEAEIDSSFLDDEEFDW